MSHRVVGFGVLGEKICRDYVSQGCFATDSKPGILPVRIAKNEPRSLFVTDSKKEHDHQAACQGEGKKHVG